MFPGSLVVRIPRSHRGGRGSIPRLGRFFFLQYIENFQGILIAMDEMIKYFLCWKHVIE